MKLGGDGDLQRRRQRQWLKPRLRSGRSLEKADPYVSMSGSPVRGSLRRQNVCRNIDPGTAVSLQRLSCAAAGEVDSGHAGDGGRAVTAETAADLC